jgi:hypothetical protein
VEDPFASLSHPDAQDTLAVGYIVPKNIDTGKAFLLK